MKDIKLNKSKGILKFGIIDENGKDTGEYLEFDVEDVELPLRLSKCNQLHDKNIKELKAKMIIIEKKQDFKRKNEFLSNNEKEKIKALKNFYILEEKALDLFLGEGGTRKLLNGRNPYYTMFQDIQKYLQPILPIFENKVDKIVEEIKEEYKTAESDVITSD